jgi:hypothetical protein
MEPHRDPTVHGPPHDRVEETAAASLGHGLDVAIGDRSRRPPRLVVTERTVETHMTAIFGKLGLDESADSHRRVLAVLTLLRA